jgi:hypothetical protein
VQGRSNGQEDIRTGHNSCQRWPQSSRRCAPLMNHRKMTCQGVKRNFYHESGPQLQTALLSFERSYHLSFARLHSPLHKSCRKERFTNFRPPARNHARLIPSHAVLAARNPRKTLPSAACIRRSHNPFYLLILRRVQGAGFCLFTKRTDRPPRRRRRPATNLRAKRGSQLTNHVRPRLRYCGGRGKQQFRRTNTCRGC